MVAWRGDSRLGFAAEVLAAVGDGGGRERRWMRDVVMRLGVGARVVWKEKVLATFISSLEAKGFGNF